MNRTIAAVGLVVLSLFVSVLALMSLIVVAQSVKVEGIIKARDGDTMILKTSSSPDITVLLTDSTRVGQVQVCSGKRKEM